MSRTPADVEAEILVSSSTFDFSGLSMITILVIKREQEGIMMTPIIPNQAKLCYGEMLEFIRVTNAICIKIIVSIKIVVTLCIKFSYTLWKIPKWKTRKAD